LAALGDDPDFGSLVAERNQMFGANGHPAEQTSAAECT
jgi:hypothetical protein